MSSDRSDSKPACIGILTELLEVTIHNILYIRKLYPESTFVPCKKYGVTVYKNVHPDVTDYINNCLKAVVYYLQKNHLKKLYVNFECDNETVLERFVIDVLLISNIVQEDAFLTELEDSLRTFILKLHSIQIYLKNNEVVSSETSFSIQLETSNVSFVEFNRNPIYENFPWILQDSSVAKSSAENFNSIVPIHMIESNLLKIQTYIETK